MMSSSLLPKLSPLLSALSTSPLPSQSTSPRPRAPSPLPRASTSSQPSFRKTEADFEALLLNPAQTVYLSGSPSASDDGHGAPFSERAADAPEPVEKRSYADDLRDLGKRGKTDLDVPMGPALGQELSAEHSQIGVEAKGERLNGAGGTETPRRGWGVNNGVPSLGVGLIPPTPSTVDSGPPSLGGRRMSQNTIDSASSKGTPSKLSQRIGPSLGIDAEQQEGAFKPATQKRRSVFRSPGTASSPDLATLVKRAKEAKYQPEPSQEPIPQATQPNGAPKILSKAGPSRPPPISVQSSQSYASSSTARTARDRSTSYTSAPGESEDGWDKFSNGDLKSLPSGERMATISEGRGRQSSGEDGFKSIRNKAKGVLGRMFGTPTHKEQASSSSSNLASPSRTPYPNQTPHPPVPPLPINYATAMHARKSPPTPSGVVTVRGTTPPPIERSRMPSGGPTGGLSTGTPTSVRASDGRQSTTPTGYRPTPSGSSYPVDKPLPGPPIPESTSLSPSQRSSENTRPSGHSRQPAGHTTTEDESPRLGLERADLVEATTFQQDIAGMLDPIGQTDPARELGLPIDSIRRRETSNTTVRAKTPRDMARSDSGEVTQSPRQSMLSPTPNPRTSSLTYAPTLLALSPTLTPPRSPSPNPLSNDNGTLLPRSSSLSRSSSTSSRRKPRTANSSSPHPNVLAPPSSGPPLLASPLDGNHDNSDFGPAQANGYQEATLRPRDFQKTMNGPPATVSDSVRLVSSPRIENNPDTRVDQTSENGARFPFAQSLPWGAQLTPRIGPSGATETPLETVTTPRTPVVPATEDDQERGRRIACEVLEDDYSTIASDKVAEFLGGLRTVNRMALRYYMQYFDMKAQTLVEAFRDLCHKLVLKAETQEIDRIIDGFSARYFECNPSTVFGTPGVVHTVTGAMLMLNTDLHIAELAKHMSRSDFVRNALRAVQESLSTGEVDGSSTPDLVRDDSGSLSQGNTMSSVATSSTSDRANLSALPPNAPRSASSPAVTSLNGVMHAESSIPLSLNGATSRSSSMTVSSFIYSRAWETEAENALKDIYNQVRADRILLPTNVMDTRRTSYEGGSGRNKTIRSPARSNDRVNQLKRGSVREMQGLMNNPYGGPYSDGTLSPTGSYAGSIDGTFSALAPSVGFASNLTHATIREHDDEAHSVDSHTTMSTNDDDMSDDELALLGAPWAKEGLISRRTITELNGKTPKHKGWKQYFVVVQTGDLCLFTFGAGKTSNFGGGSVGGGNWMNNANALGTWNLMHTVARNLGKAGDRENCFSISFPGEELYIFQAGTEELVLEWVQSCNYWAARRSRQPLQGGVSNMEYGWSRVVDVSTVEELDKDQDDRASVKSGRSNMSKMGSSYGRRTVTGGVGIMDKAYINEWKVPLPAAVPSPLDEETQLETLVQYVRVLREEADTHKAMETPMSRQYRAGSKNAIKARDNWTARSSYLGTEIYKYQLYADALRNAIALRVKKQGERRLEKSLARSMISLHRKDSRQPVTSEYGDENEDEHDDPMYTARGRLSIDPTRTVDVEDGEVDPTTPIVRTTPGRPA